MPPLLLRFLPLLVLTIAGGALALWIVPLEARAVEEHLVGFPTSDSLTLQLRPVLLAALCLLPAAAAFCYGCAGSLDRYLARQMLGAVGICGLALMVVWVLLDVNDNIGEFQAAENPAAFLARYYAVALPSIFVLLVPFALMLGLLYSLGRLSNSREIVAMLQTGRGVARVIAPLGAVGLVLSLACLLLNYHWAPWGEGYKEALLEYARSGSTSQARNILFVHRDAERRPQRIWVVGSFPYDYTQGEPLRDVEIRTRDERGIATVLKAPEAAWNAETRGWTFKNAESLDLRATLPDGVEMGQFHPLPPPPADEHEAEAPPLDGEPAPENPGGPAASPTPAERYHTIFDYPETPWQIVKPGLEPENLGIPGLKSWLNEYGSVQWAPRLKYLTQWHYRWAQPWICLVVVLLAAPLGIVFTRRGTAGGVAIALFLSGAMLFAAELFLALGDAGRLPPTLAAWSTNLVFVLVALFLLYRRLKGRPIYQALKNLLPAGD